MEDKPLEQTIDQPPSASTIDQITKLPEPRPKEKVKNPKRVAAGKKLSEYNRKARKSRDAIVKEQQRPVQGADEENIDGKNNWLPETSFTTVITVLGLGLSAIDLFLRYKSEQNYSKIDEKPVETPIETPVQKTKPGVDKTNISSPLLIRGME